MEQDCFGRLTEVDFAVSRLLLVENEFIACEYSMVDFKRFEHVYALSLSFHNFLLFLNQLPFVLEFSHL